MKYYFSNEGQRRNQGETKLWRTLVMLPYNMMTTKKRGSAQPFVNARAASDASITSGYKRIDS